MTDRRVMNLVTRTARKHPEMHHLLCSRTRPDFPETQYMYVGTQFVGQRVDLQRLRLPNCQRSRSHESTALGVAQPLALAASDGAEDF